MIDYLENRITEWCLWEHRQADSILYRRHQDDRNVEIYKLLPIGRFEKGKGGVR